jgi:hypothetical protein
MNKQVDITNYAFEVATSIESTKPFSKITVKELCAALRQRLNDIEAEDDPEAFNCYNSYECERTLNLNQTP